MQHIIITESNKNLQILSISSLPQLILTFFSFEDFNRSVGFAQVSLCKGFGTDINTACWLFSTWCSVGIKRNKSVQFSYFPYIFFSLYLSQRQEYSIAIIASKLQGKMRLLQSTSFFFPERNSVVVFPLLLTSNLQ